MRRETKILSSLTILLISLIWVSHTNAAEYLRKVAITSLLPIGNTRPAATSSQNLTRVYVTGIDSLTWGNSDCRADAADLMASDKHLLSALLTAWTTGKSIAIYVEDTLKPHDTVCQITALSVQ